MFRNQTSEGSDSSSPRYVTVQIGLQLPGFRGRRVPKSSRVFLLNYPHYFMVVQETGPEYAGNNLIWKIGAYLPVY
jgi:hypothetical protein